jgi:hypothetical protein
MGIWLEPPDYGPGVSLESEPAASCIDCLRSARAQTLLPITASSTSSSDASSLPLGAQHLRQIGLTPQVRRPRERQKSWEVSHRGIRYRRAE